jgi:site-specific DNA-methyltransferase (adenine-specific)
MVSAVDNLELLKSQPDESVDLIYCDILYGTGKDFMDYKDLYPIREIIEEHYLPRLKEMKRVLKSTGSIYLQMDYRIVHWVRCMMDDIFGYSNFKNEIIWSYRKWVATKDNYSSTHDNILFYTKSKNYNFNLQYEPLSKETIKRHKGRKQKSGIKDGKRTNETDNVKEQSNGTNLRNVFDISIINSNAKERIGYATQKPKALIERIIRASSNEGDVVADYYLGSGTTAVVCQELKRNFIGCDINPKAIEITNNRLN